MRYCVTYVYTKNGNPGFNSDIRITEKYNEVNNELIREAEELIKKEYNFHSIIILCVVKMENQNEKK